MVGVASRSPSRSAPGRSGRSAHDHGAACADPSNGSRNRDVLNDWSLRAEAAAAGTAGAWDKLVLLAAVVGIAFVVLYTLSFYLLAQTPLGSATDEALIAYYADGTNLTLALAAMLLMPFAGSRSSGSWSRCARRPEPPACGQRVVGKVHQATGIVFVTLLFVATAGLMRHARGHPVRER